MRNGLVSLALLIFLLSAPLAGNGGKAQGAGDTGRYFVDLASGDGQQEQSIIERLGGRVRHQFQTSRTVSIEIPPAALPDLEAAGLEVRPVPTMTAADDKLGWGVDRIDAERVWGGADKALNIAPNGITGAGIKVAIIDSGIDSDHPDLAANIKGGANWAPNGQTKDSSGYCSGGAENPANYEDEHGHGTHVAGIVAAVDNAASGDGGLIGVAPQAGLYILRALDRCAYGYMDDVARAVEWASGLNGGVKADIISMSLACYYPAQPAACDDPVMRNAVNAAYANNILLVAAAGNNGNSEGTGDQVGYPAAYDSVIAVAATTSADIRALYSSTGPKVELAAPGASVYSTYLNGGYTYMSGTSMAAPHVAGLAALVKGANPGMTASAIRTRLQQTVTDMGAAGRDPQFGYGLINAPAAVGASPPPASDTTKPSVTSTAPTAGATGVAVSAAVSATFSEDMQAASFTASTFKLTQGSTSVSGSVSYNAGAKTATFTPASALASNTTYTATLTAGVKDTAGNGLAADYVWSFTTAAAAAAPVTQQTGFRNCGATLAASGGDGNGFQSNPLGACADGGAYASDDDSGTASSTDCNSTARDRHVFFNYGFALPAGATVKGIEARLDAWVDSSLLSSPNMCVQLSWDGGVSWTALKQTPSLSTVQRTFVLGGAADTWGRSWTANDLTDTNFRVRVTDVASSTSRDFRLDWIAVQVTYLSP